MRPLVKINSATVIDDSYSGYDVILTDGFFPVTLADPSTFANNVEICFINFDVMSGKRLVNFPIDVKRILYPRQSVSVRVVDGAWVTRYKPGRWSSLSGAAAVFVANEGDDNNDGLTRATAVQTPQRAFNVLESDVDVQYASAVILLKPGQVHGPLSMSATPVGGNLIQVSVDGPGTATIAAPVGPAINVGDHAQVDIRIYPGSKLILDGNATNAVDSGVLYNHNDALFDMEGDVTFIGHGNNSSAIFFDGSAIGASIQDGFKLVGRFRSAIRMDEGGGRFTTGGIIDGAPDSSGNLPFIDAMFEVFAKNELIIGNGFGGHWYSVGPSRVSGDLLSFGSYIPGGVSVSPGGRLMTAKY